LLDGRIASLPSKFLQALKKRDEKAMKESVDRNFNLRREIWGDEALGGPSGPNLRMIEVGT
jgi:singapore isolate B (sub-type 7) whole genome shotgun sequence assembly, scaffold_0